MYDASNQPWFHRAYPLGKQLLRVYSHQYIPQLQVQFTGIAHGQSSVKRRVKRKKEQYLDSSSCPGRPASRRSKGRIVERSDLSLKEAHTLIKFEHGVLLHS